MKRGTLTTARGMTKDDKRGHNRDAAPGRSNRRPQETTEGVGTG